jgi:hypothetical protein
MCNDCRRHFRAETLRYTFVRVPKQPGLTFVGAYCSLCYDAAVAFRQDEGMAPYVMCTQGELFGGAPTADHIAMSQWFTPVFDGKPECCDS